jgi:hypothetical protein
MKLIASVFVLCLMSVYAAAQGSAWKEFHSVDGKFSVEMPGDPEESVVTVNIGSGDRHSNTFTYSDEGLNQFMVAYSDRTSKEPRKSSNEELFDKVRKGILIATEGKLLSESSVTLSGFPGREIVLERGDGTRQTERFYLVNDRVYQVSADIRKRGLGTADVERFLNSFRLTQ